MTHWNERKRRRWWGRREQTGRYGYVLAAIMAVILGATLTLYAVIGAALATIG